MKKQRTTYDYRDGAGRRGRAYQAGIAKLLAQGRRLTVQRTDRIPRRDTRGARAAAIARAELGVTEMPHGSNSGPRVRVYQASTSVAGTGWPWCQAFVRFVWDAAGIHVKGYRGAYVPHLEAWAKASGFWREPTVTPEPGWAVVFDWQRDQIADHVGLVVKPGEFIEGNAQTGQAGDQSNGGAVVRRTDRAGHVIRGYVATSKGARR